MKKLLSKNIISIILLLLHFLNSIALSVIISNSSVKWYFEYFAIFYCVLSALIILGTITKSECYTINLSESDVIHHNYISNIDYIKKRTGLLEEDIILKSVDKYNQQLELKEETDSIFNNFETLYKHFETISTEDKWELLYALPSEYHTLILKRLIREEL
ncbi:MAG: hypothetical protein IJD45_01030 [Clostridia bacterium]|nr:hypothetical protein [Clostridia bacterium]